MKTVTILKAASDALQATYPHTFIARAQWEANAELPEGTPKAGTILWVDTTFGQTTWQVDNSGPISKLNHTALLHVVQLVDEIDTYGADIDPTDVLDTFALAFIDSLRSVKAVQNTVVSTPFSIDPSLTDENVGGITGGVSFTVNRIC